MAVKDYKLGTHIDANNSARIKNLPNPTADGDAVSKQYMISYVQTNAVAAVWLPEAITSTILNPTNISGTPTAGDRYLIVGTGAGGWSGHDNQLATYVSGTKTLETSWTYSTPQAGVWISIADINDALLLFTSSWARKSFESTTASTGLTKSGNDIRLDTSAAGNGLNFNAGALDVNVDNNSIELNSDALRLKAAGVNRTHLNANCAGVGITKDGDGSLRVIYGTTSNTSLQGDEATATPTNDKVVRADGSGKVDGWVSNASTTVPGKVELATQAETEDRSSTTLGVTPAGLVNFVRKFVGTSGNGQLIVGDTTTTSYPVVHNLGTKDFTFSVRTLSDDSYSQLVSVTATDNNTATFDFLTPLGNGVDLAPVING